MEMLVVPEDNRSCLADERYLSVHLDYTVNEILAMFNRSLASSNSSSPIAALQVLRLRTSH